MKIHSNFTTHQQYSLLLEINMMLKKQIEKKQKAIQHSREMLTLLKKYKLKTLIISFLNLESLSAIISNLLFCSKVRVSIFSRN